MDKDRILLDIETQRDFFDPSGNCYTLRADKAAAHIRRIFGWARKNEIPVISTVLRVRKGERGPLSNIPHCIEDSPGEQKMASTLMPTRINLGLRNTTDLPRDIFERFQQVIFEKRDTDILAHARLERLVTELGPYTFILLGAGVARGIVQAAVGLRRRGFGVILARDAVVDLGDPMTEMAYLRMEAKSVVFAPTTEIITAKPVKARRRASFRESLHLSPKAKTSG